MGRNGAECDAVAAARLAARAAQVRAGVVPALVGMAAVIVVTLFIARVFEGVADPAWFHWWLAAMAVPPAMLAAAFGQSLVRHPDDAEAVRVWLPFGRATVFVLNLAVIASPWVLLPDAEPLLRALMLMLYTWFMATEVLSNVDPKGGVTWVALAGLPLSLGIFLLKYHAAYALPLTAFLALTGLSLFVLERLLIRAKERALETDVQVRIDAAAPLPVEPPAEPFAPAEVRAGLTRRQVEVLRLLARGMSNKDIARTLAVSPATVKTHVADIIAITGAANRTGATMRAQSMGLL